MFFKSVFLTFLLGVSNLISPVNSQRIEVNKNLTVDYVLTYESDAIPEYTHHNLRFPTVYYDSPAIITYHTSLNECQQHCATLDYCTGVYQDWNQSLLMTTVLENYNSTDNSTSQNLNSDTYCYLLSDLGIGYEEVNITSNSYTKIQHHNFSQHLGNNSISVVILEAAPANVFGNSTAYLDLNHNGVLDEMEPNISTQSGVEITFQNLSTGRYLVRTDPPAYCHQLFPGMQGDDFYFVVPGDGYIDTVNSYYHHAHSSYITPHGGFIDNPGTVANKNFSFILGNDNNTYLSFYPDNNITVGFVDETVVNEFIIEVYGTSSTWAHVSVSHNNIDFTLIGTLNGETTTFNITASGFDLPVAFVRLHFMGTDPYIPLNIVSIHSPQEDIRAPEMGFLVGLPVLNSEYSYLNYVLFYHDCYNNEYCEDYCYYMSNNFNREESCITGCNIFYETETCQCQNWRNFSAVNFYGDEFDMEWCHKGCHYELGWSVGPEFVPIPNQTGISEAVMETPDTCPGYCLYDLYDNCVDDSECKSFSYDMQTQGLLYNDWHYQDGSTNYMMLRRLNMSSYIEFTTTSTSATVTSTSATVTSTSATVTSTSATNTSTSATVTSTSATLTSNTETTPTITSTTETQTTNAEINSTTSSLIQSQRSFGNGTQNFDNQDDESGSGLYTTSRPSNSRSSSDDDKDNTVLYVLVSLFIVILVGFTIIGLVIYKRRSTIVPRIQNNGGVLGFDNPVYNHDLQNNNRNVEEHNYANYPPPGHNQDVLYQDTDGYQPDADYLEIQE